MHHPSPSELRPARTPATKRLEHASYRLSRAALAFLVAVSFVLVQDTSAQAVVTGLYELDGNVVNDPGISGDDAVDIRSGTSGALATTVVNDPVNTGSDIMFQSGGGSFTAKDTGDVSEWRWTNKEPGDKLDLIDVLASQYLDPVDNDPYIYIGATRYDGSGASTLGFWFLQDPVELGSGGRFNRVGTNSPGRHVDGDVLIVADFGGTNLLDIYRWSGTGPVLESTTTLSCLAATASTPACGVSNPSAISSPWPIEQKGYPTTQIGPQAFVELGVNLESTLGNNLGCYQSIVATSRASDSITATLNDLALAGVSTCDVSIDKAGPVTAAAGETVTYSFEISNDGITPLTLQSVTDDVIGPITTQATAAGCGSLGGGESCSFTVDYTVPTGQAAGALTNTVTAGYQPPNGRTTASASDSHTTQVYRPAVTVTKTADIDPVNVGSTVTYTYVITNATQDSPGTASPAMSITSATDDLIGSIGVGACGSLSSGASCTVTATDVPDGTVDPLVNEVEVVAAWGSVTRTATAFESIDVNRSPVATDDEYTTDEDTVLIIPATGILSNDTDPDGDTLSVQPVTDTIDGDVTVGSDGSLTFDPAGAFESLAVGESTSVTFDYTATDPGGLTAMATVEITIDGVNDPIDANPDSYIVDEGQTLTVPAAGVLANDSDPDTSDTLAVVAFDATSTGGGTVSVGPDGSFTYTPAAGFTGTDTFTYTVTDGKGSSVTETVTVTVAPAPDVVIGDATATEGGDLEFGVGLSRTFSAPIEVTFSTADGSATAGDDYTATSITITFDPGDTTATVTVPTIDDSTDESDETLTLSVASSSTPIGDTTDTGTGTIVDDDAAPAITISDASATEGEDLSFTVTLSNPSAEDITIVVDASDVEATAGSDYTDGPYSVTITAGATSGTLIVGTAEDTIDEPSETFTLSVTSTSGGAVGDTTDTGTGTITDDDPAPTVTISDATVTEGGDLSFEINLSNPSSATIVVTLIPSGVTAAAGDDYDGSSINVTFMPGATSATAVVLTFDDVLDEPDETLTVGVGFVIGTVGDTSDTGTGTILDDDATPDLVVGDVRVTEGGDLVFDVSLTAASGGTITVDLATADGTAVAGDDYIATSGTVTFAPGVVSGTFTISTLDDLLDELGESVILSATGSTGTIGDISDTGTGTIIDDDATPDLVIGDVSVTEGGDLVFDVSLTGPSGGTITVDLATADGTAVAGDDYTSTTGTVTFAPGVTTAMFTVPTTDDSVDESDETLTVLAAGSTGTIGDISDTGTGTIEDDDAAPTVTIDDVSVTEGGDLLFTVSLSNPSASSIELTLRTADGTAVAGDDYASTTGTVTFAPGVTTATFTVPTVADLLDEADETLMVSIDASTGPVGDASDTGTGTIEDDDATPVLVIGDVSVIEGGDLVFDVSLTGPSGGTITVDLATADGTAVAGDDYTSTTGTVTFAPGVTTATFTVPTVSDLTDEPDETLTVSATGSTGTIGDTSDTGTGTIEDDDAAPTVTIDDATVAEGGDLVFGIALTNPSSGDIELTFSATDVTAIAATDYAAGPYTVTIPAGDTTANLTVSTIEDPIAESDETFTLAITGATGTIGGTSDTATGTITDDDADPDVLVDDATITEGGDLVFNVTLTNPSASPITVDLTTTNGTAVASDDYTATTDTVTFLPGETSATFTVPTLQDTTDEPDETLTVSASAANGTAGSITDTGTGTIVDDDDAPDVVIGDVSVTEGGSLVFDVTLSNASSGIITVDLATSDGTALAGDDYTATTGTVTFAPGVTMATLTVPTSDDAVDESDETLTVSVTGTTGTVGDTADMGTGTIVDDDDAPAVVIGDVSVNEGGDLVFDISLTGPSASAITVDLTTADGTAVAGDDYTSTTATVTFAPGLTTLTFTVPTTGDDVDESNETLTVSVTGATGPVGDTSDIGIGTIVDDDNAPAVVVGDVSVIEGGDLVFDVTLSNPSSGAITVDLATADGTATAGDDYTSTTGTVTFAPGVTAGTFSVPTTDDAVDEPDETLTVSVTGTTGTVGDTSDTGTGTIVDDEGTPTVTIGDATIDEGGNLVFPITLTGASGGIITLEVATADASAVAGTDYTAVSTSVVFTPGSTSATVTVPTIEDAVDEPDETLTLSITSFTGTVNGTDETGTGTILDDDPAPDVTIADASATEGSNITVTVTLGNPSSEPITITIGTADGTATAGNDYTSGPYIVTFPAGTTVASFDIPTGDDLFDEVDETIDLSITAAAGTVGDTSDTAVATILDDDGAPTVTISDASVTEGGALIFDVTLSNPATADITVTLATADGTATEPGDYPATTSTLTFAAGDTAATFTVATVADTIDEVDETLTVSISASTGPVGDTSDTAIGTIVDDDDAPNVTISDVTVAEGSDLVFVVTLSNPASGTITLDLVTADGSASAGSDYTATTATLTFAPGETSATFTVPTTDDDLDEPDETLTVSIDGSTGTVGDTSDTGTGTITDDDATPDITISDATIGEGGNLVFDVSLTAPSADTITVTVATFDGSATAGDDYTATSVTLTFDPGVTSTTVTVPTLADTLAENDETLTLSVTGATGTVGDTTNTGTGTITDDDAPDVTIDDATVTEGENLEFTVSISTTSSIDTVVTITTTDGTATAGSDYTATTAQVTIPAGDSTATFTVPTTGDLIDEADETLVVSVASVDSGFAADTTDTGTGTITDDDGPPNVTIADTSTYEGTDATFTVSLSNPSATDVVLEVTPTTGTAGAGDVDLTPITVTIPAGSTSVTFGVPTFDDTIDEDDETFGVAITAVNAGTVGDTSDTATGTILDDDTAPSVSLSDATATEGDDLRFTIALSNGSSVDITLSITTTDGTAASGADFNAVTTDVTIPAGATSIDVPVGTIEDAIAESTETMTIAITGVVSGVVVDPTGETGTGTITDDDAPSVTISDVAIAEGDPAGFTITLSNPSTVDTTLVLQPTAGTATGGSDFDATPISVTLPAGDTSATVTVPTIEDTVAEPTEAFTLAVAGVTAGLVGDTSDTGTGTITDDDAPNVLIDDVTAAEGDALVFTVTLTNPTYETIEVVLTPTDVTATGGVDYTAGAVTATFAPGDTSATATIAGIADTTDESDETFTLAVTSSTGALGDTSDTGTGTIVDDDGPPSVTIGDATTAEGGNLTFPITLSNPSSTDITIVLALTDVTTTSGADYPAGTVTVTIPAGDTTGSAVVPTIDDTVDEATETVTASIASTSGGTVGDISDTATGTITDNDAAPAVTISDATAVEGGDLVFDVALSNASSSAITVTFVTTDGTATNGLDYTGGSFDVTFAAGDTTGTVTVVSTDDAIDEADETFTVSVGTTTGGDVDDTTDVGTGTITDDDLPATPNVSIGDVSVSEGGDLVFPVTLDIPAVDTIELQISTTDGTAVAASDYTATTATVMISAGASSASFTVPTTDDADVETDETLTATITSFTGTASIADDSAVGTIVDNDAAVPDVVIGDVTISEGETATFTVNLTGPAIDDVTITLSTSDATATAGTDYTATTVTVTIPAGATSGTFSVPTIEDSVDEPDETFGVAITSTTGTVGDTSDTATGTIVDDDPAPTVSIADASTAEGGDLVFSVTLSNPSTESITVTVSTSDSTATDGADYTGGSFDVVFAPGDLSGSVAIPTLQDTDIEPDETLTLSVAATSGGAVGSTADTGIGTITDDDVAPTPDVSISDASITEGGDLVFDVTLSAPTTQDVVLTLATSDFSAVAGADYTATTVAVTIPAGSTTATVTVPTLDDLTDEPDETLTLSIASVDSGPVGDTSDTGTGTINDDDTAPSITLDDATVIEGGDAVVPITLSNASSEDITITLAIVGGTADDADRPNITVTVTISAGATSATATFPTTADSVDEPDETFVVAIASVDTGTAGDVTDTGTVTILDDDGAFGSITGQVWFDENSNVSIDPGEVDISGVTVELYQSGPDSTFGTGDDVLVGSTVTASPYQFTGLAFGNYQVRIVSSTVPAGHVATGDFDGGTDSTALVPVFDATPLTGVNFGFVVVAAPNNPPIAVDDSATTVGSVTISVLGNDSDPDSDPLTVDSAVQPANGTVVIDAGGTVTYTPDAGFVGTDTFTYTVCDPSGACDTATVTVTVNLVTAGGPPANNPPDYEIGFVPELSTVVGGTLGPLPLVDPDGDTVSVAILSGVLPNGVTLNPDGTFTGIATASGTFVLELELCDDGVPVACVVRPLTIVVDEIVGNTPPPPLTPESPAPETPATEPPGPIDLAELPFTGLETQGLIALALTLLGAGALLLRAGRSEP